MKNSERDLPLDGEINPNHPVTHFAREQWPKICALLMDKMGKEAVEITVEDVDRLSQRDMSVVMDTRGGKLFIRFMPRLEGEKLARNEGGFAA